VSHVLSSQKVPDTYVLDRCTKKMSHKKRGSLLTPAPKRRGDGTPKGGEIIKCYAVFNQKENTAAPRYLQRGAPPSTLIHGLSAPRGKEKNTGPSPPGHDSIRGPTISPALLPDVVGSARRESLSWGWWGGIHCTY